MEQGFILYFMHKLPSIGTWKATQLNWSESLDDKFFF